MINLNLSCYFQQQILGSSKNCSLNNKNAKYIRFNNNNNLLSSIAIIKGKTQKVKNYAKYIVISKIFVMVTFHCQVRPMCNGSVPELRGLSTGISSFQTGYSLIPLLILAQSLLNGLLEEMNMQSCNCIYVITCLLLYSKQKEGK